MLHCLQPTHIIQRDNHLNVFVSTSDCIMKFCELINLGRKDTFVIKKVNQNVKKQLGELKKNQEESTKIVGQVANMCPIDILLADDTNEINNPQNNIR